MEYHILLFRDEASELFSLEKSLVLNLDLIFEFEYKYKRVPLTNDDCFVKHVK